MEDPNSDEVHIGTVKPFGDDDEHTRATHVDIYVTCMPAQFFRFEITRLSEDTGFVERLELSTGSATLSEF